MKTYCISAIVFLMMAVASRGGDIDPNLWLSTNQDRFTTGLVESQVGFSDHRAFTYDQALAIIVFTHADEESRARQVLDRMQILQSPEGYWRSGYSALNGSVWEWDVGTGPVAWMVIAANYHQRETGDCNYAHMAAVAIEWLEGRIDTDPNNGSYGALNLGIDGENIFSTEHQLDAYAAFRGRAVLTTDCATWAQLNQEADHLLLYLMEEVWQGDHFQRGYADGGRWLDCQTFGLLALGANGPSGEDLTAGLDYAYDTMRRTLDYDSEAQAVEGLSYNDYQNTIWVEGTLQAALAHTLFGNPQRGAYFADEMARTGRGDGGLSYSFDESGTGEDNWPPNLRYSCVSSVAWYYFCEVQLNPLAVPRPSVCRFWSPSNSRHFYTMSAAEKDYICQTYPLEVWTYECTAFRAFLNGCEPGVAPVYRFWSPVLSAHFYTISESERNLLLTDPYLSTAWDYETIAFYAFPEGLQPAGASPVYRFWSNSLATHFYTISEAEKDYVAAHLPTWQYEGIAWYAYE